MTRKIIESFKKFSFLSPMPKFLFIANDPCLDFVNTEVVLVGARTDLLQSFTDLTAWFEQANLPSILEMQHKLAKVWGDTREAKAAFQAARVLRNVLRNSVERVASVGTIPGSPANILKDELKQARLSTDVVQQGHSGQFAESRQELAWNCAEGRKVEPGFHRSRMRALPSGFTRAGLQVVSI